MYPHGALQDNLAAFCEALRRQRGFVLGPAEISDAARALALIPLHDETAVRHALRPILCSRWQDAAVFDRAFDAFFYPGPMGVPQPGLPRAERDEPAADAVPSEAPMRARGRLDAPAGEEAAADASPAGATPVVDGGEDDDVEDADAVIAAHWSPL